MGWLTSPFSSPSNANSNSGEKALPSLTPKNPSEFFVPSSSEYSLIRLSKFSPDSNFFLKSLDNEISEIIINQNKYIPDLQIWFNNSIMSNKFTKLIKEKIKYCNFNNNLRNKFLSHTTERTI